MTGYEAKGKGILYYKCNKVGCKVNKNAEQLRKAYNSLLNDFAIDERLIAPLKQKLVATIESLNEQKAEDAKRLKVTLKVVHNKLAPKKPWFWIRSWHLICESWKRSCAASSHLVNLLA
ncbi:hypothetical protein [Pontibacter rugosus]|uniref:Recombinase zinc beta ribbon domain-containing protein n=1 Tax=Pontibacter rugosus TaxID=1745966 RepID=A0ABW3SMB4_9BACT